MAGRRFTAPAQAWIRLGSPACQAAPPCCADCLTTPGRHSTINTAEWPSE